tara:strand:+ start:12843 stop:14318 length:1476 start_codon:yes stop_codon:yes gene_type:complete
MKKIINKIGSVVLTPLLAGQLAVLTPGQLRADFFQDLAKKYNVPVEVLQKLRGEAFNDLMLEGIINGKSYNLQGESFEKFLQQYGNEGDKVYSFLTQKGIRDVGLTIDDVTKNVFLKRVIATPDSVGTASLKLSDELGDDLNKVGLSINSPRSVLYNFDKNNKQASFEIEGFDKKEAMDNLGSVLRNAFGINLFLDDLEVKEFREKSGIGAALINFFNYKEGEVKNLFEDYDRDTYLNVDYTTNEGRAEVHVELRDGNGTVLVENDYDQDLPKFANGEHNFEDYDDMKGLGLEEILAMTPPRPGGKRKPQEQDKPDSETEKESPYDFRIVVGGGVNPKRGLIGFGKGPIDIYGGVGMGGNNPDSENQRSAPDAFGNYHETERNVTGDETELILGTNFHYRFRPNWSLVFGGELGAQKIQTSGKISPRQFDASGEVIDRNPDQVIFGKGWKKQARIGGGPACKGISLKYNYNLKGGKHDVQFTFPIKIPGGN